MKHNHVTIHVICRCRQSLTVTEWHRRNTKKVVTKIQSVSRYTVANYIALAVVLQFLRESRFSWTSIFQKPSLTQIGFDLYDQGQKPSLDLILRVGETFVLIPILNDRNVLYVLLNLKQLCNHLQVALANPIGSGSLSMLDTWLTSIGHHFLQS